MAQAGGVEVEEPHPVETVRVLQERDEADPSAKVVTLLGAQATEKRVHAAALGARYLARPAVVADFRVSLDG